jgi:methanogenic corrinoid protein MtbC1
MADYEMIKNAMGDLDEDTLTKLIDEIMADGGSEAQKALEACQDGMQLVGDRFEAGEYFVADLIFAGEILTGALEKIKPAIGGEAKEKVGRMILCTVHGDLHDIGKNIVKAIMEANSFEVLDLGIDTPVDLIVSTAKEQGINIVALSGVLTLALDSMKATVEGFKVAGLRDRVKIIIGGNPVTEEACRAIGADAWAHSPQKSAEICRVWASA